MTTPIWITGYEYGLATPSIFGTGLGDYVSGTVSIQSTIKRTGSYALKLDSTSATTSLRKSTGSASVCVVSFYVYIDSAWAGNAACFIFAAGTIASTYLYYNPSTQRFSIYAAGGTTVYSAGTYATGQWIRFDMKMDGSAGTTDWRINGGSAETQHVNTTTGTIGNVGPHAQNGAGIAYYDDIIMSVTSSDYPIGEHEVIGLRPDADGTHNNAANIMEDSAGNDIDGSTYQAYTYLDEDPWVSTAGSDYVRQTAVGTGNYCEIQFADTTQSTILGVMALLQYCSASATANTGACIIRSNTTETTLWGSPSALADYSESSCFYKSAIVSPDGGSWSQAVVNALRCRFGYSDDATPDPYWQAIMLEVAYVAATGVTVSPSQAEGSATATAPTVIYGSISIAPSLAEASATATAPDVVYDSISTAPGQAEASATASDPTVTTDVPPITPNRAQATTYCPAVTVVKGSTTAESAAAESSSTATEPTTIQGSLALAPSPAQGGAEALGADVLQSSSTETPAAAIAGTEAANPDVLLGALPVTPAAAEASALAAAPTVELSSITVSPSYAPVSTKASGPGETATAGTEAIAPTVMISGVYVSPEAAIAGTTATAPTVLVSHGTVVALTLSTRSTTLTLAERGGIYNLTTITFEDGSTISFEDGYELIYGDVAAGLSLPARNLGLTLPALMERRILR